MISLEDAISVLESRVSVLPGEEQIPIGEARGRVLARQITARSEEHTSELQSP